MKLFKRKSKQEEPEPQIGDYLIGRVIMSMKSDLYGPRVFESGIVKGKITNIKPEAIKIDDTWYATIYEVGGLLIDTFFQE